MTEEIKLHPRCAGSTTGLAKDIMPRRSAKSTTVNSSSRPKKKTPISRSKNLSDPKSSIIGASVRGSTKANQRRSQRSGKTGKQIEQADENEDEAEVEAEIAPDGDDDDDDDDAKGIINPDEEPPTAAEWKKMEPYGQFIREYRDNHAF